MNILAYVHLRNIHRSTGAGRVARELVEHLAARPDVNIHLLADNADYQTIVPQVGAPWTGFPCHLFSSDTSVQQAKWLMLRSPTAEHFWPDVQVVHCTGESYVPTRRSRLVVTAHDAGYFDPGVHRLTFASLKQSLKWRVLFSRLAHTVDIFHTVSRFSADRLAATFPALQSRIRVIYNAVSPFFFKAAGADAGNFLKRMGLKDKKYILLPGGLSYRKNAEMVLKAWPILSQRIPDLILVIASHNQPEYVARIKSLGASVVLTGFIEDEELRTAYQGAEAVWFPSRYEGFGLPVLEAMAGGTPVVASNAASIPEIAGNAALLVSPDSVDENVDALDAVVNDSALHGKMREQGIERAGLFTWTRSAEQLCELYASLI